MNTTVAGHLSDQKFFPSNFIKRTSKRGGEKGFPAIATRKKSQKVTGAVIVERLKGPETHSNGPKTSDGRRGDERRRGRGSPLGWELEKKGGGGVAGKTGGERRTVKGNLAKDLTKTLRRKENEIGRKMPW